jgi:hypothetical protein
MKNAISRFSGAAVTATITNLGNLTHCSRANGVIRIILVGLFWAFFHSSLSPNIELAALWPFIPVG